MARTLWCRHADCGKPIDSVAGEQPQICPACQKSAHWTSVEGAGPIERRKHLKGPRVKFDLNLNDKRLLRSLRIAAE